MKKTHIALSLSALLFLTACSDSGIRGDLDKVLNDTFEAEEEYREVQGDLEKREKAEQKLFADIMSLTQEDQNKVEEQAQEALDSAEERLAFLKTEKESMQAAEENLAEIDQVIEKAEDKSVQSDLEVLKAKMEERFTAHDDFVLAYEKLIGLQKELYEMLKEEDSKLQDLQDKATAVNEQNTLVQKAVTEFNELTQQVNDLKDKTLEKITEYEG